MRIFIILIFVGFLSSVLYTPAYAGRKARCFVASWYDDESLKKEGTWARTSGIMANGFRYDSSNFTCASWDWPIGSCLIVRAVGSHRFCVVRVTDRTARRFAGKRIDLSRAAFAALGDLDQGIIKVEVEEIVKPTGAERIKK